MGGASEGQRGVRRGPRRAATTTSARWPAGASEIASSSWHGQHLQHTWLRSSRPSSSAIPMATDVRKLTTNRPPYPPKTRDENGPDERGRR